MQAAVKGGSTGITVGIPGFLSSILPEPLRGVNQITLAKGKLQAADLDLGNFTATTKLVKGERIVRTRMLHQVAESIGSEDVAVELGALLRVLLTLHVAQLQLARQDKCTDVEELQPDMLGSLEESGGGRDLNG